MSDMKKIFVFALSMLLTLQAWAGGRKTCIDFGWKFHYGAAPEAVSPDFDDSAWRTLDLPHDWSVETEAAEAAGGEHIGPFSRSSVGGSSTGQTVGGEGWYRKTFTLDSEDAGKRVMLYFEGAYNHTDVWLNGRHVYFNHYGYSSFRFDITEFCHAAGTENVLTVKVTNNGVNTRWYAGSGIYRHVWLIRTPQLHQDTWDNFIQTPEVSAAEAKVNVQTNVLNQSKKTKQAQVEVLLYDAAGRLVASGSENVSVKAAQSAPLSFDLSIANPQLWSPESPALYRAVIRVTDEKTDDVDETTTKFGVRSLAYNADEGFLLNGESVLLQGGCVHHDTGLLGAAAYNAAEDRKLRLLKNEGFNAVRCSHNMPSEHFLDACDSLGLMVIDEAFDQWLVAKNNDDYHNYFAEFSDRDLQTMVRRDRNHPSIVLWSIGNEIPGRITADGQAAAARLRETVRQLDTTRGITAAIPSWDSPNHAWSEDNENAFKSLDVGGYNYLYDKYESDHTSHPDRVMVGLESYPKRASEHWVLVEEHPYVIGDFVWTAMDYLGEAGIGSASFRTSGSQPFSPGWPWFNGWCGDIDLIGTKKPQSYYRDVVWHRAPVTMAVEEPAPAGTYMSISAWGWQLEHQSWTFDCDEGTNLTVNVYSRAPQVRLYLNDQLLDTKTPGSTFWAGFSVPYQKGTLRAVTFDGTNEGESFILQTTGQPVALRLVTDRTTIRSDGADLAYVTAELVDAEGNVVSDSSRQLTITVDGEGTLLAAGNACPYDMESFRSSTPKLFEGRALAIAKATRTAGTMTVNVACEGLASQQVSIRTTDDGNAVAVASTRYSMNGHSVEVDGRHIRVVQADGSADGSAHIYNMQGQEMPVASVFEPGVYVVKVGAETTKVLVK